MKKFVLPLALVATVVASSAAHAATATGSIMALDAKACTVTIDKSVYSFGKTCDFSKLKVGEKVVITYSKAGTMMNATAIKAA